MTLLGAVLAGGHSRRMGMDKAAVLVSGASFLERVTASLAAATDHVVVLGEERDGYETWPDQAPGWGPLAGVATALGRMEEDRALIVAVDNVFVREETLRDLAAIESDLPVVPVDRDGIRQVTCAVFPRLISGPAWEEAEAGGSIQTLLDRVSFLPVTPDQWEEWGEDGRSWFSADTRQALDEGLRRFG
jgi:molybdopterin-guanine dinucleotide biosynthesis protein A